jgi:hypothetical protein
MKQGPSIAPTTVIHDSLLLTAPQLDAPALTWIPAGTMVQPLAMQQGFFTIAYQHHRGFFPIAVCTPWADPSSTPLRFAYPKRVHARPWVDVPTTPLTIIPAGLPLVRLGQDQTWVLIQWSSGRVGFVATHADWNSHPPSCITAVVWYLLGAGWLVVNWISLLYLTSMLGGMSALVILLTALVGLVVPIVFLARARSDFTLLFSMGALTVGVIGSALSLALLPGYIT